MPTLQLLRHAKSAWPPGVPDELRPLNERGRRDAPVAGELLAARGSIDLALVSPATRTRETYELVSAAFASAPTMAVDERIYAASTRALLTVLAEVADGVEQVLMVGHNPGVEMLAWRLAADDESVEMDELRRKFPTSGLAQIDLRVPWSELASVAGFDAPAPGSLTSFVVPRG